MKRFAFPCALFWVLSACEVTPTNAYDCDTPVGAQAAVTIKGKIQSVLAPFDNNDDGEVDDPIPGSCADIDGDHSGYTVVLRGLGTTTDNSDTRVRSQDTNESGEYVFENVKPGEYLVEFQKVGFASPPPVTVELGCGEEKEVATLCAVKTSPPAVPTLEPLPELVGSDDTVTVRVLDCDENLSYQLWARPEGEVGQVHQDFTVVDGNCEREIELSTGDDSPSRETWRIEVSASDALGNVSEPAVQTIVKDTLPPGAPTIDANGTLAGADRIFLKWDPAAVMANDDGPVGYLISYTLVPRPVDEAAACPRGQPDSLEGDAFDTAQFILEGPSPLLSPFTEQTLSGILPGTEIHLQVAAMDAAGNLSCWSEGIRQRPDRVTPVETGPRRTSVVASRMADFDGVQAYGLGTGGIRVVNRAGDVRSVNAPAHDIVFAGRTLYAASGVLGIQVLKVDGAGDPIGSPAAIDVGSDVRSLAHRPGRLIAGTSTGVKVIPLDAPASAGSEVDLDGHGGEVSLVAAGQGMIAVKRQSPSMVQLAYLDDAPVFIQSLPDDAEDMIFRGDQLWISRGALGLAVYDLSGCARATASSQANMPAADGGVPDDGGLQSPSEESWQIDPPPPSAGAPVLFRGPLPTGPVTGDLVVWDDLVAVAGNAASAGDDTGGIYLLSQNEGLGVQVVGRTFSPPATTIGNLVARTGELCAAGNFDGTAEMACYQSAQFPLVSEEKVLAPGRPSESLVASGDALWAIQKDPDIDDAVLQVSLSGGQVIKSHVLPQIPVLDDSSNFPATRPRLLDGTTIEGVGHVSMDNYGRLMLAPERVDVVSDALIPVAGNLPAAVLAQASSLGATLAHPDNGAQMVNVLVLKRALLQMEGDHLMVALLTDDNADSNGCYPSAFLRIPLYERGGGILESGTPEVFALDNAYDLKSMAHTGGIYRAGFWPFAVAGIDATSDTLAVAAGRGLAPLESCHTPDAAGFSGLSGVNGVVLSGRGSTARVFLSGNGIFNDTLDMGGVYELGDSLISLQLSIPSEVVLLDTFGPWLAAGTLQSGAYMVELPDAGATESTPILHLPSNADVFALGKTGRGVLSGGTASGIVWTILR